MWRALVLTRAVLAGPLARDPRLSRTCREVYGAWSSWGASDVLVRTIEDVVHGELLRPKLLAPYGRLLPGATLWIEVPKAPINSPSTRIGLRQAVAERSPPSE